MAINRKTYRAIEQYIQKNILDEDLSRRRTLNTEEVSYSKKSLAFIGFERVQESESSHKKIRNLEDLDKQLEETFSQHLFRLIKEKDFSEVDTYKKARVDRKLFSKIRSDDNYTPGKNTAIAFALALELSFDETLDLIGRAGYTLSHSSKSDLIVEYFINNEIWDLFQVNEALNEFNQPLLRN